MLAAVVAPHPPLLVPALAAGAAAEVADLLQACESAVAALAAELPQTLVLVGDGDRTTRHRPGAWGTLAGFGVAVEAPATPPGGLPRAALPHLPLSLTIGRWLLDRVGWSGQVLAQEVAAGETPERCAALGRQLAEETGDRSVWLVLGDGTSCRGPRATGAGEDPRAAAFDEDVVAAFAAGDAGRLADLDPGPAAELGVSGRAPWQVLAAAVSGPVTRAGVDYAAAPFGVGYAVARWWFR